MLNAPDPNPSDLPSSAQLLKSTGIALVAALALLVFIVLPAEYAIDPTGVGDMLGLKRMGEIKAQLAEEAALEEAPNVSIPTTSVGTTPPATEPASGSDWTHETSLTLAPDEAAELKLIMTKGARAEYEWIASGPLNYNVHGDGNGQSVEYRKGRAAPAGEGEIVAAFDGYHGYFWRNRSEEPVTLTWKTRGEYAAVKRTR